MKNVLPVNKSGIVIQKEANAIRKELVRKSIHVATCFVPYFLEHFRPLVLWGLTAILFCYCLAEFLRIKGKHVVLFSFITEVASRKRDENKFVLGPVTLAVGVLLSAVLFERTSASIAIYALAFGDGLSSLAGKTIGKHLIPFCAGKTVEGSLTCFVAIFLSTMYVSSNTVLSLIIAFIGTIIEVLPIRDFDNVIIPLVLGFVSQCYFHM